jgi:RHS repeat-associated protein
LTELRNVQADGTVLSSFAYTCDNVGNRTQVVEANEDVVSWSYDPTYQLTREWRSGANSYNVTYTYDAVGNRTLKEDSGARTTYTYNAGNQLVTEQSPTALTSYTYDANGNTTVENMAGARTTYTWDGENRLSQVDTASGSVAYTYDGEGLRRSGPGVKYVWDGQKVLLETDTGGNTTAQYTLSEEAYGNLISQQRSGVSRFYHFDGLGNTDRLTDVNQGVTDSYTYLAFGEEKASSGSTTNPFRYVGRSGYYRDGQTPLLYLRVRYYDPGVGRFMSIDPSMQGINGFLYTRNSPANGIDPTGLSGYRLTAYKKGNPPYYCPTQRIDGILIGRIDVCKDGKVIATFPALGDIDQAQKGSYSLQWKWWDRYTTCRWMDTLLPWGQELDQFPRLGVIKRDVRIIESRGNVCWVDRMNPPLPSRYGPRPPDPKWSLKRNRANPGFIGDLYPQTTPQYPGGYGIWLEGEVEKFGNPFGRAAVFYNVNQGWMLHGTQGWDNDPRKCDTVHETHGCISTSNGAILWLRNYIPIGTPMEVVD